MPGPASSGMAGTGAWQVQIDGGRWVDYEASVQRDILQALSQGVQQVSIRTRGQPYVVDTAAGTQVRSSPALFASYVCTRLGSQHGVVAWLLSADKHEHGLPAAGEASRRCWWCR